MTEAEFRRLWDATELTPRQAYTYAARRQGMVFRKIGAELGVTGARAQQLYEKARLKIVEREILTNEWLKSNLTWNKLVNEQQ